MMLCCPNCHCFVAIVKLQEDAQICCEHCGKWSQARIAQTDCGSGFYLEASTGSYTRRLL